VVGALDPALEGLSLEVVLHDLGARALVGHDEVGRGEELLPAPALGDAGDRDGAPLLALEDEALDHADRDVEDEGEPGDERRLDEGGEFHARHDAGRLWRSAGGAREFV